MNGTYTLDDLLKLRNSPLVTPPSNLTSILEILSAGDVKTIRPTTKAKPEDAVLQNEGFQKRPPLDTQRKSTTDPERIVLGPPRRSFASSNAKANGKAAPEGDESAPTKEKTGLLDKLKAGDDWRTAPVNGRYSGRHHGRETSSDDRARRRPDDEDGPRSRRDARPKWAGDDNDSTETRDAQRGNFGGRFDALRFRNEKGDSMEDTRRDGARRSDWRQDRGKERNKHRDDAPAEEDPEWMDAPQEEPQTPVRTQEDFQRWKEKMKAGKSSTTTSEKPPTPTSPPPNAASFKPPPQVLDLEADDSMDKFLAKFSENKAAPDQSTTMKATGKTRFASLFGPPPSTAAKETPPQPPVTDLPVRAKTMSPPGNEPPTATADQAGFARIMEMLQARGNNPNPQDHVPKGRVPLYARDSQSKAEPERAGPTNLIDLLNNQGLNQGRPEPDFRSAQIDQRPSSLSPVDYGHNRQQSHKDESLINLLRQASQAPKPTPVPHDHEQYGMRSMFSEDAINRAAMKHHQMVSPNQMPEPTYLPRRENSRQQAEDSIPRYQEDLGFYEHLGRRPTNEAPRQGDDPIMNLLRGQKIGQQGPPPGLGRPPPPPPGLDSMPRPPSGWPPQAPPPNQQHPPPSRQIPPPGMPNMPRNLPSGFPPPGMPQQRPSQPQQPGPPPPPPQQQPPRKYTGDNFPLTMAPPPGFLNNAGPPPGFPGGPQNFNRYGGPEPNPMGRQFGAMYEEAARQGIRGAGPPPGHR